MFLNLNSTLSRICSSPIASTRVFEDRVKRMNPSGHIVVIRRDGTDGLTCDWCSPLCDIGR